MAAGESATPTSRLRGCRGLVAKLALALGAVVFSVLLLELGLRLTVGVPPDLLDKTDPVLGVRYRAGMVCQRRVDGRRVPVRINRLGFHSPEQDFARPAGVQRLLFLGDSFTGATEVPLEQTFHQTCARQLSDALGSPVESISLGVATFSPGQEYLSYRELGRRFECDGVVLCLFVGNDIADNVAALSGYHRPYFELGPGGELHPLPFRPRRSSSWPWLRQSALYNWQKEVTNNLLHHLLQRGRMDQRYAVYNPPADEPWRQAWALAEASVLAIRSAAVADGHPFLLAVFPEDIQVCPDRWGKLLEEYPLMKQQSWDLTYPQQRLQAFAAEQGIELLDVTPACRADPHPDRLYTRENPHFAAPGHALAARLLTERLEKLGWLNGPEHG